MRNLPHRRGLYAPELLEARIAPATFIVTTLADSGAGSLRQAVLDANDLVAHPGADTIVFKIPAALLLGDGTGTIHVLGTEIAIRDTLTITGPGIDILKISGDDARRIFKIDDGTAALKPVTISGLTFLDGRGTNGSANGGAIESLEPLTLKNVAVLSSFSGNHGGGVSVVTAGKVSITGSKFTDNESNVAGNKHGGGVFLQAAGGISIVKSTFANNKSTIGGGLYAQATGIKATMLIDSCVFTGNTAPGRGGGLFVDGKSDGKILVKNSLITGNTGGGGGGLYQDAGNLTVSKTTFSGNTGSRGGAMFDGFSADSTLLITGSRFLGNHSTGNGGALYLGGVTTVPSFKIVGTLFSGNTAAARGGAITLSGTASGLGSVLEVSGSSFVGNSATLDGGAIYVREKGNLHLNNSVLSGNLAGGDGGAIWTSSGKLDITGSKFTENKASSDGGAITITGPTTLTLGGNLFQANASQLNGGAVYATGASILTSKSDKFIGNVAIAGQGGAVNLINTGAITVTGSLFQSNVAAASGGAILLHSDATFTSVKILDNVTGAVGRGGGMRISDADVLISKSVISGNVASQGGGIYRNLTGVVTLANTVVKSNAAGSGPNLIGVLLSPAVAPPTGSATIIVDSLLDNGDGTKTTLREAILLANANPGADTIAFQIPAADLPGVITLNGTQIPISGTLTIKGLGIDLLSVSGNDLSRIFLIGDGNATLNPTTISGLTLTNGNAPGSGGAIYSYEPLTLNNVVIRKSAATDQGGGVFVTTDGKISIVNSRIVQNEATNGSGGLHLRGNAGISIVKTTIANNTAGSRGGAYAGGNGAKSAILIDTCIISNNTATSFSAGGLHLAGVDDGKIIVKNSLITGNSATVAGGGLYHDEGNLLVTNTTFSNNKAARGGAIADDAAKSLTISGSRFLRNSATDATAAGVGGGALYVQTPSVVKITGTLFAGNSSARDGGAISDGGTVIDIKPMTITGSSFLANTAAREGGALDFGFGLALTMKSSILSGNSAATKGGAISLAEAGTLLSVNLTGNKFTDNKADAGGAIYLNGQGGDQVTANLTGNLFQANVAQADGGAVMAIGASVFTSKSDKFIGNLVITGQGGAVNLSNTGGIFITGSLFQSNVADNNSGGGLRIAADATLTSVKVLENIAGPGGRGGGLRIGGVGTNVLIFKSVITGNVANDGGGIFFDPGTAALDPATLVKGNAARVNPNAGST